MNVTSIPAVPVLQEQLTALIRALGLLEPEQTPCGQPLSPSAAHALMELGCGESLSQGDLAARLCLEKSTVSRLVGQLEARGWVERRRAEHDGRVLLVRLTDDGRKTAERIAAARTAFFARLCERIPPGRRGDLIEAMEMLVEAVHGSR
jgi:DNA-binding MarR family transcriptional regulator